jgi:hypothetical protein
MDSDVEGERGAFIAFIGIFACTSAAKLRCIAATSRQFAQNLLTEQPSFPFVTNQISQFNTIYHA